jgi:hypothetical protein
MAVDLPGNHRSLNARQKLLRFGQGQTQVRDIAKTFRPTDFYQIGAQAAGVILGRNQSQHPSHQRAPSRLSTGRSYLPCRHPPIRLSRYVLYGSQGQSLSGQMAEEAT